MRGRMMWLASAVAAGVLGVSGMLAPAASASAQAPGGSGTTVINLASSYRSSQASLAHAKPHRIAGVVYSRGRQPQASARAGASCAEPKCPLTYNGGPVQHSPHVYLLLWGPAWSTNTGEKASAAFLKKFYAGLGVQPKDTWSTITSQYADGTGAPGFSGSVFMGAWQDTSTPPHGVGQTGLASEADAFTSYLGITDLTDAQVIVATQSGTCPAGFYAPGCYNGSGYYCAWHSASNEPFTNLPYELNSDSGCGKNWISSANDAWSVNAGHEYAETVTDPWLDAWWDQSDPYGGEIGDKCSWALPKGKVTLSTGTFGMQSLWSNAADACVMSSGTTTGPDTVTVTSPGNQVTYVGGRLKLAMHGSSSAGKALTWSATGLPAGLTIASATGLISGKPTTVNTYSPVVKAADATPASGTAAFGWTILADVGTPIKGANAKCLDDKGMWVTAGNPVDTTGCTSAGSQKWTLSSGQLVVLGQCLTDPGNGGVNTKLVIDPCAGTPAQTWTHLSNNEYVLGLNNLCLTEVSTTNGTQVQIHTCQALATQKWIGS